MTVENVVRYVVEILMNSRLFIGGVAFVVFALGILFGLLSAKSKIKKGIDLYED